MNNNLQEIQKIHGVYDYETDNYMGKPKEPASNKGMDQHIYDQWVAANKPEYKEALIELNNKITHVSYKQFTLELKETIKKFNESNMKCQFVAFVQPGKSQKWVTEIAMTQGFNASLYVCLGEQSATALPYSLKFFNEKDERFQNCVIIDDGSYSGTQMCNNITAANRILKKKFNYSPAFHILIPYITNTAFSKINQLGKSIQIKIFTSKNMPLITEVIKEPHLKKITQVLWPHLNETKSLEMANSRALYWFDHKIPNSMSFPDVLEMGLVTQPIEKNDKKECFVFISPVHPPYKEKQSK